MLGREAPDQVANAILAGMNLKPGILLKERKDALAIARQMLTYCAMTPAFQTR